MFVSQGRCFLLAVPEISLALISLRKNAKESSEFHTSYGPSGYSDCALLTLSLSLRRFWGELQGSGDFGNCSAGTRSPSDSPQMWTRAGLGKVWLLPGGVGSLGVPGGPWGFIPSSVQELCSLKSPGGQ